MTNAASSPEASGEAPGRPAQQRPESATIDMRKLADKVYQLFLEDLRLERARGARTPSGKGPR